MQQTYPVSMLEAMSKGPDLDLIAAACVCVGAGDWECHTLTRATKRIAAECLSFFDALANEHQIQSLLLHGAQQTASDHHVCQSPDMLTSHKTEDACQLDLLREVGQLPHKWERVLESCHSNRTICLTFS